MSLRKCVLQTSIALAILSMAGASSAATVTWTDWTSLNTSQTGASGMMGSIGVTVSATGGTMNGSQTQLGSVPGLSCLNYWTEPNAADRPYTGGTVSNAPTACEQVALTNPVTVTVSFTSAVNELYMALLSVGQVVGPVTYDFDQSFTIDSEGEGFWGNDPTDGVMGSGDTLTGREFHGLLRFSAPVTSLTFSTGPLENWHAFTFGSGQSEIPEPGSLALVCAALLAAGGVARRRHHT